MSREGTRRLARLTRIGGAACALLLCGPGFAAAAPEYEVELTPRPAAVAEHWDPIDMTRGAGGPPAARMSKATLSSTSCGGAATSDRTSPSLGPLPTVKVIFAHPSDKPHFNNYRDFVQSEVKAAADRVAAVSGATKTIRFDVGVTGPGCANPLDYVDIQVVALSKTSTDLKSITDISVRRDTILTDVQAALGAQEGVKNYAIFAHAVRQPGGAEGVAGVAQTPVDDAADPGNFANAGGRFAFVFGTANAPSDPFFDSQQYPAEFFLHEVAHTLGAVQDSAPHSTGAGHCVDEHDVMCYADGGPKNVISTLCGAPFSATNETFDCGLDDYFNPAPPEGSYLATHWNLQSSQFMCPLARCQTAGAPPAAALAGPAHGHVGSPFTLNAGVSTDDTGIAAYDWDTDANGTFETGTGATPTLTTQLGNEGFPPNAAVSHPLRVAVTDGDGALGTARLDLVIFPPLQIAGGVSKSKPKIGEKVTFDARQSRDPAGDALSFAWDFDGNGTTDSTSALATHAYRAPGRYTARVTVADPHGNAASATVAIAVPEPAGPASVRKLRLKPTSFSAESKGPTVIELAAVKGTTVSVTMSKSSTVRFTVQRRARVRGRTVYRALRGSFSRKLRFGANSFKFTGRFNKRSLATGSYRLVALPTTKRSKATRTAFRIVK